MRSISISSRSAGEKSSNKKPTILAIPFFDLDLLKSPGNNTTKSTKSSLDKWWLMNSGKEQITWNKPKLTKCLELNKPFHHQSTKKKTADFPTSKVQVVVKQRPIVPAFCAAPPKKWVRDSQLMSNHNSSLYHIFVHSGGSFFVILFAPFFGNNNHVSKPRHFVFDHLRPSFNFTILHQGTNSANLRYS